MRIIPFALAVLGLSAAPSLTSETLAHLLEDHKLPANLLTLNEGEKRITSFAVSADNSPFLLAYYDDDGSGMLPQTLHVLRYSTPTGTLRRVDLHAKRTQISTVPKQPHAVSVNCMGSALSISEQAGFIFIGTHINPSAGCVLILRSDLTYSHALYGWVLAKIGGHILVEESMIHFAATQRAKLFLYDARRKRSFPVYPLPHDPARQRFSAELQKHLPTSEWCARTNNTCDPEDFATTIENVQSNQRERTFSYDAQLSAEAYGKDAEASVNAEIIHYKWRQKDGMWRQVAP